MVIRTLLFLLFSCVVLSQSNVGPWVVPGQGWLLTLYAAPEFLLDLEEPSKPLQPIFSTLTDLHEAEPRDAGAWAAVDGTQVDLRTSVDWSADGAPVNVSSDEVTFRVRGVPKGAAAGLFNISIEFQIYPLTPTGHDELAFRAFVFPLSFLTSPILHTRTDAPFFFSEQRQQQVPEDRELSLEDEQTAERADDRVQVHCRWEAGDRQAEWKLSQFRRSDVHVCGNGSRHFPGQELDHSGVDVAVPQRILVPVFQIRTGQCDSGWRDLFSRPRACPREIFLERETQPRPH